jgi:DNA-binding SARP family transcriptional activator
METQAAKALRIFLLGSVMVMMGAAQGPRFPTRRSESLLGYLAANRMRAAPREVLADELWGERDEDGARKCLRTEIWRLRSILEPTDFWRGKVLAIHRSTVQLAETAPIWIDTTELETAAREVAEAPSRILDPGRLAQAERVLELYRGDFMSEHDEPWCIAPRERLRALYLATLQRLVEHHLAQRDFPRAVLLAERALSHDPYQEPVHRGLMLGYSQLGDRARALRQFGLLQELLQRDLGIGPMPETVQLRDQIRHDGASPSQAPLAPTTDERAIPLEPAALHARLVGLEHQLEAALGDLRRLLAHYPSGADRLT